jgi:hypothetical protein
MSFLYRHPAGEYRQHRNREGELVPANREWHQRNGSYAFAYGLGSVIVAFAVMVSLHPWLPQVSTLGSFLVFGMSLVTLWFLVTTPECRVPALGSPEHGFPLLSGAGRLVIKDANGQWHRSYGNELWDFDESGLMRRREAKHQRRNHPRDRTQVLLPAPGARPTDHPGVPDAQ